MERLAFAHRIVALAAACLAFVLAAHAQEPLAPVEAAEREAVITAATEALEKSYVYPEVATRMATDLRARAGAYAMTDAREFARAVTSDLQAISRDKHLRLFP